jgi:hypothetical protein
MACPEPALPPDWLVVLIRVDKAIDGTSYPAIKDEPVEHARGNNAGPDVLYTLQSASPTGSTPTRGRSLRPSPADVRQAEGRSEHSASAGRPASADVAPRG